MANILYTYSKIDISACNLCCFHKQVSVNEINMHLTELFTNKVVHTKTYGVDKTSLLYEIYIFPKTSFIILEMCIAVSSSHYMIANNVYTECDMRFM